MVALHCWKFVWQSNLHVHIAEFNQCDQELRVAYHHARCVQKRVRRGSVMFRHRGELQRMDWMKVRYSWLIAVFLLAGCGDQDEAGIPTILELEAELAARADSESQAHEREEAQRKNTAAIAALEALGGKYSNSRNRLNLSSCPVTDADLATVKLIFRVETLRLTRTQITDAGLDHLSGRTDLRTLNLSNTQITDAGLTKLKGLPRLMSLDLRGTQVTDAGLEHLKEMPRLMFLQLSKDLITEAGVDGLSEARPDCSIFWQ
jgi:hypothetical protein